MRLSPQEHPQGDHLLLAKCLFPPPPSPNSDVQILTLKNDGILNIYIFIDFQREKGRWKEGQKDQ